MMQESQATKKTGVKILLLLLAGCNVSSPPTPTASPPSWKHYPQANSSIPGQFSIVKGEVEGDSPLTEDYYWAKEMEPPLLGDQAASAEAWIQAGWTRLVTLDEPITGLKSGGKFILYGVARNTSGFSRTPPVIVEVVSPIGPTAWKTEPVVDMDALSSGQLLVEAGEAEGENHQTLNPMPEYRYYYAPTDTEAPESDLDQDWTAFTADERITPVAGEYQVYIVASNNGGSLRFNFNGISISAMAPVWMEKPQVQTSEKHGEFTLLAGGVLGGNPVPEEVRYYYAVGYSPPGDAGDFNAWTESPKIWQEIRVGETKTSVIPASNEYHLYGVAVNSEGFTLSDKIIVTVKGLAEWKEEISNTEILQLNGATFLGWNDSVIITGGINGVSMQSDVWRGSVNPALNTWEWVELTDLPTSIQDHTALIDGQNNLYIVGGRNSLISYNNTVWKGTLVDNQTDIQWIEMEDDIDWVDGRWHGRIGHSTVYHEGAMYLMGGVNDEAFTYNDVWKSIDGRNWTRLRESAAWSARCYAALVSYNGKLWLLGGLKPGGDRLNDIWVSTPSDTVEAGVEWTKVQDQAPWKGRERHIASTYHNRIWIMGGYDGNAQLFDIWHSEDGENWYEAKAVDVKGFTKIDGAAILNDTIILRDNLHRKLASSSWVE